MEVAVTLCEREWAAQSMLGECGRRTFLPIVILFPREEVLSHLLALITRSCSCSCSCSCSTLALAPPSPPDRPVPPNFVCSPPAPPSHSRGTCPSVSLATSTSLALQQQQRPPSPRSSPNRLQLLFTSRACVDIIIDLPPLRTGPVLPLPSLLLFRPSPNTAHTHTAARPASWLYPPRRRRRRFTAALSCSGTTWFLPLPTPPPPPWIGRCTRSLPCSPSFDLPRDSPRTRT